MICWQILGDLPKAPVCRGWRGIGFGSVENGIEAEEFKHTEYFYEKLCSEKESVATQSRSFDAELFCKDVKTDTFLWPVRLGQVETQETV